MDAWQKFVGGPLMVATCPDGSRSTTSFAGKPIEDMHRGGASISEAGNVDRAGLAIEKRGMESVTAIARAHTPGSQESPILFNQGRL